jgi:surface polysaccharide O-acyltransferase-like enzyme
MSETKKLLYADYIRVIATVAMILLHGAGDLLYTFDEKDMYNSFWWVGNLYDSAVRWCVPVFIMLSGSLLLKPKTGESIGIFLEKRMLRVAIPFLFWAAIYLAYDFRGYISDMKLPWWPDVWFKFLFQDVYFHLWFVPMILGLYFLTPTFRVFIKAATREDIEYFLVFWFYISVLQVSFSQFFLIKYIGWLAYIGYFVMGYYLATYSIDHRQNVLKIFENQLFRKITYWICLLLGLEVGIKYYLWHQMPSKLGFYYFKEALNPFLIVAILAILAIGVQKTGASVWISTKKLLYATGWVSFFITVFGTWYLCLYFHKFEHDTAIFYLYLSPNVIFMGVALFVYWKDYNWERFAASFPNIHRFVLWFSSLSFGVYLVHALILDIFKNGYLFDLTIGSSQFFNIKGHPLWCVPAFVTLTIAVSLSLIWLLSKVPFLKKLVN